MLVVHQFLAYKIVKPEIVTGLQPVTVPFYSAAYSHLYIRAPQLGLHAVVWLGGNVLRLQPCFGLLAQMFLQIVVLG